MQFYEPERQLIAPVSPFVMHAAGKYRIRWIPMPSTFISPSDFANDRGGTWVGIEFRAGILNAGDQLSAVRFNSMAISDAWAQNELSAGTSLRGEIVE